MLDIKKTCTAILAIVLLASTGCSSEDGKVNVISGPGKANSTMLISFNELCSGSVEGFLGNSEKLLTRLEDKSNILFNEIDSDKGTKRKLFSTTASKATSVEIAPDGSNFLCNNCLINTSSGLTKQLPIILINTSGATVDTTTLLSYSFTESSEILLINPLYYIQKYFTAASSVNTLKKTALSYMRFTPLGDRRPSPGTNNSESIKSFKDIVIPDITSVKSASLISDRLKCVFTASTHEKNTPLYILDLYKKEFTLIANSVKDYSLSPGRTIAAYVDEGQNGSNDRLMTINLETGLKKELISLPQIEAAAWSENSSWIAYSGGSTKIDIGIIKADGTSNEQLTNGMHPSGKPSWSSNGKKLAFTSYDREKEASPKVYIITLNNQEDTWNEASSIDSARDAASEKFLDAFRYETHILLGEDMEVK